MQRKDWQRLLLLIQNLVQTVHQSLTGYDLLAGHGHAGHIALAVDRIVDDLQGLALTAEHYFLGSYITLQAHAVDADAVDVAAPGTGQCFPFIGMALLVGFPYFADLLGCQDGRAAGSVQLLVVMLLNNF